jgi:hypothetical protein
MNCKSTGGAWRVLSLMQGLLPSTVPQPAKEFAKKLCALGAFAVDLFV